MCNTPEGTVRACVLASLSLQQACGPVSDKLPPLALLQERLESKAVDAEIMKMKMKVGSRVTLPCTKADLVAALQRQALCLSACPRMHLPMLLRLSFKRAMGLPLCCILAAYLLLCWAQLALISQEAAHLSPSLHCCTASKGCGWLRHFIFCSYGKQALA